MEEPGRDMETQKLKICFNKKTFRWEYIGTAEEVEEQRLMEEYDQSPVVDTIRKLVKQGNGHWEGSASDIVEASKYLGCQIYDDVRKVGSLINKFEGLFWSVDGINCKYSRTKKERNYVFNVINVTHIMHVDNVTHVTA